MFHGFILTGPQRCSFCSLGEVSCAYMSCVTAGGPGHLFLRQTPLIRQLPEDPMSPGEENKGLVGNPEPNLYFRDRSLLLPEARRLLIPLIITPRILGVCVCVCVSVE